MFLSYLDIQDVKVDGEKVKWDLSSRTEPYGSPISVKVGKDVEKNGEIEIAVSSDADISFGPSASLCLPLYHIVPASWRR
jgi:hypothetical protein